MKIKAAGYGLTALLATLPCAGANAADLPANTYKAPAYMQPAPAPFSWTGFYVGANVGGGFTGANAYSNFGGGAGGKLSGAIGGLQAGYNYQLSPMFVVGIENDLAFGNLSHKADLVSPEISVPWLSTGRARAGIAVLDSRLLLYSTAGLAAGELKDGPVHKEDGLGRRRRRRMGVRAEMVGQARISLHRPQARQSAGLERGQDPHRQRRRELPFRSLPLR